MSVNSVKYHFSIEVSRYADPRGNEGDADVYFCGGDAQHQPQQPGHFTLILGDDTSIVDPFSQPYLLINNRKFSHIEWADVYEAHGKYLAVFATAMNRETGQRVIFSSAASFQDDNPEMTQSLKNLIDQIDTKAMFVRACHYPRNCSTTYGRLNSNVSLPPENGILATISRLYEKIRAFFFSTSSVQVIHGREELVGKRVRFVQECKETTIPSGCSQLWDQFCNSMRSWLAASAAAS